MHIPRGMFGFLGDVGLPGKATDPAHWLHMDFHDDAFDAVLSWRHWLAIPRPIPPCFSDS